MIRPTIAHKLGILIGHDPCRPGWFHLLGRALTPILNVQQRLERVRRLK